VEQLVLADIWCLFTSLWRIWMTACPPMANRCCVDRSYHIRLIRSNRLCYYWSSHTFLITDLFVALTHILIYWTIFVLLSQRKQFIRVNRMPYIAHTLIWMTVSFVLPNHKQFIRVNSMLYIAHTYIWLPYSFVPPHRKQLIELNRLPFIAHATKIWTVFVASSNANVFTFFTVFMHHHLRLLHRTQFLEGSLSKCRVSSIL
jgi:hypothetical protein